MPAAIVADAGDNAYIAGATQSSGYPTLNALVPRMLPANTPNVTSGFLTRLNSTGSGVFFSTFIPGGGVSSLALDTTAGDLLLSGTIALGEFPITSAPSPMVATPYQVVARLALDGSAVLSSTAIAPALAGSISYVAPGRGGGAWIDGALSLPLLPLTPLSSTGTGFAAHLLAPDATGQTAVDQTARFGGLPLANPSFSSLNLSLNGIALDATGNPIVGGTVTPTASSSLLASAAFDLPLTSATSALPSTLAATLPSPSSCINSSLCSGSAGFVARLATTNGAALALSADNSPIVTVRNLGSAEVTGLNFSASGFGVTGDCGSTLAAGDACSLLLTGSGPGSVTVQAAHASSQTAQIAAVSGAQAITLSSREVDFGVVTSSANIAARTVTVTNLGMQTASFVSMLDATVNPRNPVTSPFSQTATDCLSSPTTANTYQLASGASCHITLGLAASSDPTADGILNANWLIGSLDLRMTGYSEAANLSLSASEIDFGLQFIGGLHAARSLFLSNNGTTAVAHTGVTLPNDSPFTVTDLCPSTLEPATICAIQLTYHSTKAPSTDSVTLTLDEALSVLVIGETLPQPTATASAVNPNLTVTPATALFVNQVVTTSVSSETQTITITNTGATAFSLTIAVTGDFVQATNCAATLAAGASCRAILNFVPSQPGTREGLFAATAGSGTSPAYVALSGVATPIFAATNGSTSTGTTANGSAANGSTGTVNNSIISFGQVPVGQPTTQWLKITQPFSQLTATSNNPDFTVILVEDTGYGHGQPPSTTFVGTFTGSCGNCWLGITNKPSAIGPETAALVLTSTLASASTGGGSPYALTLTAIGLPLTGMLLNPLTTDFGPVNIGSSSDATLFSLTNQTAAPITVNMPTLTGSFSLSAATSGGQSCGGPLAAGASCFAEVAFNPLASGPLNGTLTITSSAGTSTATLTGYGLSDPGIALSPAALIFANVPGTSSTAQTITVSNTAASVLEVGTPTTVSTSFAAQSNCGTLNPGQLCTISVSFTPQSAQVQDTLSIPVIALIGGNTSTSTLAVPLSSSYTTEDAGLQIIDAGFPYGPSATSQPGLSRQFTLNNLTAKSLDVQLALPRQFVLVGSPCAGLAPNASCTVTVGFLPLTNGDITGTLFAQAMPTDGSATLNGLGYVEGYGSGQGSLAITGAFLPGGPLDFGQVASGQSASQTLTLTNTGHGTVANAPVTIRRITGEAPFLSTSTCETTLAVGQSCTVTITYSPLNQVPLSQIASGGVSSPISVTDTGTLVIESDAITSPNLIDLTGTAAPVVVNAPSNNTALAAYTTSQGSLTFATIAVGDQSPPQTIDLVNTGTATIHILKLTTTPDFTVQSPCSTLIPGQSCSLTVSFTPQSVGSRIGALEIASDASTSLDFVSLIGGANPSIVRLSQPSLNFGSVLIGAGSTLPVTLTNSGSAASTINAITASGDYAVTSDCPSPGNSLAPNTSCTAQVTFSPTQTGVRNGTLSVSTSSSALPITAALTGTGVQSQLQITPTALAFSSTTLGLSSNLPLTLTNTGSAPVLNLALGISGDYAITQPCNAASLAPGASCTSTITFTPTAIGSRSGALTVSSSATTTPTTVPLTGTGVQAGAIQMTVAPASGGIPGSTATVNVTNGNPAAYTLTVTPLSGFVGTVVLSCTPINAAPNAACSLLPSTIQLSAATAQDAAATINTITTVPTTAELQPAMNGLDSPHTHSTNADWRSLAPRSSRSQTSDLRNSPSRSRALPLLCVLLPGLLGLLDLPGLGRLTRRNRRVRHLAHLRLLILLIVATTLLVTAGGCGGGVNDPYLRFTPPGTYQYQVTASSTSGIQLTQTVQLTLIVQ